MTIDEAISHAREVAEEKRKSKSVNLAPEIISECELCAQEHEQLAEWLEELQQYRAIGAPEELQDMKSNYFEALSDWRQYRKIGTLEECRAAMEKQAEKKVLHNEKAKRYFCPICERKCNYMHSLYCSGCGQKLDWSDEE